MLSVLVLDKWMEYACTYVHFWDVGQIAIDNLYINEYWPQATRVLPPFSSLGDLIQIATTPPMIILLILKVKSHEGISKPIFKLKGMYITRGTPSHTHDTTVRWIFFAWKKRPRDSPRRNILNIDLAFISTLT